jgi:hypothetical protein
MIKELIKEILKEELSGKAKEVETLTDVMLGRVCVFRTYSAGVHVGTLARRNGRECLVTNSRRIWYWKEACSLSQIATEGSKSINECKIAVAVPEILLTEVIEIIPMSEKAEKNIMESPEWKK